MKKFLAVIATWFALVSVWTASTFASFEDLPQEKTTKEVVLEKLDTAVDFVLESFSVPSTHASSGTWVYRMDAWAKTGIGTASKDTADSLVWSIADLLPILVPLLVVGFIIWIIMSVIRRRW